MKSNKIKLILALSIVLLLLFISINIYTSYVKINRTVEESIANQSLEAAKSIAASIDVETYQQFLRNPVKNEQYWEISSYLNDAKEKIGALYVYTLMIDNPKVAKTMIAGMSKDEPIDYAIGDVCTVPEKHVKSAYDGKTYVTGPIEDNVLDTSYISVGAPIKDETGKIIGYLGIDISADTVDTIGGKVLENSISILIFNGVFVLIIILTVFFMQRWYQKEIKKEVEDTEDTYQAEMKTLIASVASLRHDYANHVQVLHGLLQLDRTDQALEYLSSLSKEIEKIDSVKLNINHPGLLVLLQTKKVSAQNYNIDMQISISEESFDKMKTIDLIKMLSNLIDNAIDATIELSEEKRKIAISIKADSNYYQFKITNTGPKIIEVEKVFEQGYSTKKAEQGEIRGQGLFIVRDVVNKCNGNISIESTDLETNVFVEIPIK